MPLVYCVEHISAKGRVVYLFKYSIVHVHVFFRLSVWLCQPVAVEADSFGIYGRKVSCFTNERSLAVFHFSEETVSHSFQKVRFVTDMFRKSATSFRRGCWSMAWSWCFKTQGLHQYWRSVLARNWFLTWGSSGDMPDIELFGRKTSLPHLLHENLCFPFPFKSLRHQFAMPFLRCSAVQWRVSPVVYSTVANVLVR